MMRWLCSAVLLSTMLISAQAQIVLYDSQPRVQRFITVDSIGAVTYHQHIVPSISDVFSWVDQHLAAVESVLSTVFGVYPCPYENSMLDDDVLSTARQMFLNQLEDESYYEDAEPFGPENGAALIAMPSSYDDDAEAAAMATQDADMLMMAAAAAERDAQAEAQMAGLGLEATFNDAEAAAEPVVLSSDDYMMASSSSPLSSVLGGVPRLVEEFFGGALVTPGDAVLPLSDAELQALEEQQAALEAALRGHPVERELVAGSWDSSYDDVYYAADFSSGDGGFDAADAELQAQVAARAAAQAADVAWAFATWDFAVFMALAAACVFVWAAMFTTCCQLRCAPAHRQGQQRSARGAERQQFLAEVGDVPAELLEPLTLHDYQEPARVVVAANPVYYRRT